MRRIWMLALMGLALAASAAAGRANPQEEPAASDLADRVAALQKEFDQKQQAYYQAYRAAKTDEEKARALEQRPDSDEYAARLIKLVQKSPAEPEAAAALVWALQRGGGNERRGQVLDLLEAHHLQSEKIADACRALARQTSSRCLAFLEKVLAESQSHEVKGQACFALAEAKKRAATLVRQLAEADAERRENYEEYLGKETVAALERMDPAELEKQAEKTYERVAEGFADLKWYGDNTLGDAANGNLFELRHLAIGQKAPDIEGEDVAGTAFKLSDYRGKVVLLDFWGHW